MRLSIYNINEHIFNSNNIWKHKGAANRYATENTTKLKTKITLN